MPFTDSQGRTWLVAPTRKGMQTQEGGEAAGNKDVAYFVYRLSDTTDAETPVSQEDLVQSPDEGGIFTYENASEAQRLGYLRMIRN